MVHCYIMNINKLCQIIGPELAGSARPVPPTLFWLSFQWQCKHSIYQKAEPSSKDEVCTRTNSEYERVLSVSWQYTTTQR